MKDDTQSGPQTNDAAGGRFNSATNSLIAQLKVMNNDAP